MKIEVITCWYREHYLAPLFLQHYEPWVDKITVITERLIGERSDGGKGPVLNDHVKMNWVNAAVRKSTADWIICVDADEFVFPNPYSGDADRYRKFLEEAPAQVMYVVAEMNRVWTHRADVDVDFMKPPVPQRVHGETGVPKDYQKPCIFRSLNRDGMRNATVGIGCHNLHGTPPGTEHPVRWGGAHWQMASRLLRNERRMQDRIARVEKSQYAWQIGYLPTAEQMEAEVLEHLDDPMVIQICD